MAVATEIKTPAQVNGTAPLAVRRPPAIAIVAAPVAAICATFVAVRLSRRRQAAKPPINWSFRFASGNSIHFHPVLAPRFTPVALGVRPRAGRFPRALRRRSPRPAS